MGSRGGSPWSSGRLCNRHGLPYTTQDKENIWEDYQQQWNKLHLAESPKTPLPPKIKLKPTNKPKIKKISKPLNIEQHLYLKLKSYVVAHSDIDKNPLKLEVLANLLNIWLKELHLPLPDDPVWYEHWHSTSQTSIRTNL